MDLNDGQTLIEVMKRAKRGQPFPLEFRLHVVGEALRTVHAAHERHARDASVPGFVAHGISLKNVVIGYDGRVTVDFGTTRDSVDRISTTDGVFQGKLGYAAPEVVRGLAGDRRADVFAAGVVLWEVIALRRFTPKERTRASVEARISGFEPRIQAVVPEVDPALATICDRAMQVSPDSRYATADELRLALTAYVQAHFPAVKVRLIGEAMRAIFTRENAAARPPVDTTEEATTVGDLSVLIQSTIKTDSVPPPATTPEAPKASSLPLMAFEEEPAEEPPNRRPLIIALAAAIVAVGTFLFSMSRQAPLPDDLPPAPAAQAESPGTTPPTVAATPTAAMAAVPGPAEEPAAEGESAVAVADASEQSRKSAPTRPRLAPRARRGPGTAPALNNVHGLDEEDPFK